MPEMILGAPVEATASPGWCRAAATVRGRQADDYWKVAAASYASIGFPPEVFGRYSNHQGLLAENVAAFIAYLDDEPVSIAMTIVSHGVAGIYWVGSLEQARGKGLGRAVTAAATNAGFERAPRLPPCRRRQWASRSTRRWATRPSSTTGCSCHPRPEATGATIEAWSG